MTYEAGLSVHVQLRFWKEVKVTGLREIAARHPQYLGYRDASPSEMYLAFA